MLQKINYKIGKDTTCKCCEVNVDVEGPREVRFIKCQFVKFTLKNTGHLEM